MSTRSTAKTIFLGHDISAYGDLIPQTVSQREIADILVGDYGHYGYPNFPSTGNVGGNFDCIVYKEEYNPSGPVELRRFTDTSQPGYKLGYSGRLAAPPPGSVLDATIAKPDAAGRFAEAWNKMKPTKPDMSLANALVELRELPRQLQQRFTRDLLGASNFWVALQFGWLPLLRDVRKFVDIQRNGQKRLKQLIRDNGRSVRRRITLLDETQPFGVTSGTTYSAFTNQFVTQMYYTTPQYRAQGMIYSRCWASAKFRYWLPPGPRDVEWTKKMMRRIYGSYVSPSVVYNAIPWTWLIDWFSSVGDLVEATDMGVADRLAADYFYVMYETGRWRETHSWGTFRGVQGQRVRVDAFTKNSRVRKTRYQGNPFGLPAGKVPTNPMQLSILAALGYSRYAG